MENEPRNKSPEEIKEEAIELGRTIGVQVLFEIDPNKSAGEIEKIYGQTLDFLNGLSGEQRNELKTKVGELYISEMGDLNNLIKSFNGGLNAGSLESPQGNPQLTEEIGEPQEKQEPKESNNFKVGDVVKWNYDGNAGQGRIISFESPDSDPKVLIDVGTDGTVEVSIDRLSLDSDKDLAEKENVNTEGVSENITPETETNLKVGDKVFWEGSEKVILSIDDQWVEFVDGPIVSMQEFKEKMSTNAQKTDSVSENNIGNVGEKKFFTLPQNFNNWGVFERYDWFDLVKKAENDGLKIIITEDQNVPYSYDLAKGYIYFNPEIDVENAKICLNEILAQKQAGVASGEPNQKEPEKIEYTKGFKDFINQGEDNTEPQPTPEGIKLPEFDIEEIKNSDEWKELDDFRKMAVREEIRTKESNTLGLGIKWQDYENKKDLLENKIRESLKPKGTEVLSDEQQKELNKKINTIIFQSLVEEEHKNRLKNEREIKLETVGGKVLEAMKYATGSKAFKWYLNQNKWVRLGAMSSLATIVGIGAGS
ncbi:MAG: hypothetical protein KJZ60_01210, partial [Ignavibacteriaceae bacterium]|nr:hypothetical protein [Ignavibacteriaceae bacterium]